MQRKILIVEDNIDISDMLRNYLMQDGYVVYQAFNGAEAIDLTNKLSPDLVTLDIMIPQKDGYQVCQEIRSISNIPIIVISAKESEEDKLRLFSLGADDYLTKPFSFKEAVGRVKAQLRRYYEYTNEPQSHLRRYGDLTIDTDKFEVKVLGAIISLTAKEFKLLDVLTQNADRIFSRDQLIDRVWGITEYIDENTVAVTIARLREKLKQVGVNNVVTVWGFGYKWQS